MRKLTIFIIVYGFLFIFFGYARGQNKMRYNIFWERKADMPEARRNLKAVSVGNKIFALGGYAQPSKGGEKGNFCYAIKSNSWSVKTDMLTGRSNFAVASFNGKLYAIGGDKFLDKGEVYDPESDSWFPIVSMPTARQHINCGIIDGRIYIVGGRINWSRDSKDAIVDVHEVYDIKSNSWEVLTAFPRKIENPSMSVVKGKLYVIDGKDLSVTVYDPDKGVWEDRNKMPSAHFIAGATVVNDKIIVLDGVRPGEDVARVYVYNPADDSWGEATSLPMDVKLAGFTSVNNQLYVIGGCNHQFTANKYVFEGQFGK